MSESKNELEAMARVQKFLEEAERSKIPVGLISIPVLRVIFDRAARPHD